MIVRKDITSSVAASYVIEQLELSGKTLANLLLLLPLSTGKITAYVPEGTPENALFAFSSGGLYPAEDGISLEDGSYLVPIRNDAESVVNDHVLAYLKECGEHCCLFEDAVASPTDGWVQKSNVEYIYLEKEMYYFFNGQSDPKRLKGAMRESGAYYFLFALSKLPVDTQTEFQSFKPIDETQLKQFAENVTSLFVQAYDREGYLEWSRSGNSFS